MNGRNDFGTLAEKPVAEVDIVSHSTTPQEIFDVVAKGLLTQGRPAMTSDGTCVYRAEDGLRCGFGMIIPDRCYQDSMESKSAHNVLTEYACMRPLKAHESLIQGLQGVHDNWAGSVRREGGAENAVGYPMHHTEAVKNLIRRLYRLAGKYGLTARTVFDFEASKIADD